MYLGSNKINNYTAIVKRKINRTGLFEVRTEIPHDAKGLIILYIPFEPIWYITLVILSYVHCCAICLELSHIIPHTERE